MKKKKRTILPFLLLILLLAAAVFFVLRRPAGPPEGETSAGQSLSGQRPALFAPDPPEIGELSVPALTVRSEEERPLAEAYERVWDYALEGDCRVDGQEASQALLLTVLDQEQLAEGLSDELNAKLAQAVSEAASPGEVYDAEKNFLPERVRSAYEELLTERLSHAEDYTKQVPAVLHYRCENGAWTLLDPEAMTPNLPDAAALYETAAAQLQYVPFHYTIEENALSGPRPDENAFGVTDDPAAVEAMLASPLARSLIGEQQLLWNPEIPRLPDTPVRYYLDESILCLVWQEVVDGCVGTFTETFIADGSQLRRKISGDTPWSFEFRTTSRFASEANAVLALGGDLYYHGRACGISVYQREIVRFEPNTCDTCYITADGDMLFSYRGQFTEQSQAEEFIRDNDVLFSLCFGPVLIDDGTDVTPESYPWGEVNDTYARSALGLLGERHYLTMNLNCGQPGSPYYYLATLRQEADAMLARGCHKAYALDGGQTATTVFHNELINPVQFGWEKDISDIIYFATAVPES